MPHPTSGWEGGTPSQVQMGGVVPHSADGGGVPSQVWTGGDPISGLDRRVPHPAEAGATPSNIRMGGTPLCWWRGVLHPKSGWGYPRVLTHQQDGVPSCPGMDGVPPSPGLDGFPPSPIRRQISIASTCYTAGSLPLQ